MTEPERTPQTAPGLEALIPLETLREVVYGRMVGVGAGALLNQFEARVRAEEQAALQSQIEEDTHLLAATQGYVEVSFPTLLAERDAARAEVERLREAALELADAYDQWDQSACTFLHKHPHEPSDLVQAVRRAALSTEAAQ